MFDNKILFDKGGKTFICKYGLYVSIFKQLKVSKISNGKLMDKKLN